MPSINFQKRLAPAILSGEKRTTIMAHQKILIRPGTELYLFAGLQTEDFEHLGACRCVAARDIDITRFGVAIDGTPLSDEDADKVAQTDGFANRETMAEFFRETWAAVLRSTDRMGGTHEVERVTSRDNMSVVVALWAVLMMGVALGYAWRMAQTGGNGMTHIKVVVRHAWSGETAEVVRIIGGKVTLDNGEVWPVDEFFEIWKGINHAEQGNADREPGA